MKIIRLTLLLFLGCWLVQCRNRTSPTEEVKPEPEKIDLSKKTIELMESIAPKMMGMWVLEQVHVKATHHSSRAREEGITRDTVLTQLATLELYPATKAIFTPKHPNHPEFEGRITYRTKTYPVRFYLLINHAYLADTTEPQAGFLFEFDFPNGFRIPEKEERFLTNIGLINDNFLLTIENQGKTMTWNGLNRGLDTIVLKRK